MNVGPARVGRRDPTRATAITLDAHGVLVVPDPVLIRDALAPYSVQPDDETCWRSHAEMIVLLDRMADEPDYDELNRAFAAALGVPMADRATAGPAATAVILSSRWIAAPGAAQAVRRLREAGIRLAVVSNTTHAEMSDLLTRARICNHGDETTERVPVYDSTVIGIRKPHPAIFQAALRALDVEAGDAVHVGDSRFDDVDGAMRVGMSAVHIDPLQRCDAMNDHPHAPSLIEWVDELLA